VQPYNLVQINKMRRLNEARRDWENRQSINSPFRPGNFQRNASADSAGEVSAFSSPDALERGYGVRMAKRDKPVGHQAINLSNKRVFKKKKVSSGYPSNNSIISGTQGSTVISANASFESLSPRPCSIEDEIH